MAMTADAQSYITAPDLPAECAPAPLDQQAAHLFEVLVALGDIVYGLEVALPLRTIRPDRTKAEGLTALLTACHAETGALSLALQSLAQRIGRL